LPGAHINLIVRFETFGQVQITMTSGKPRVKGRTLAVLTAVVVAFAPVLAEARAGKGSSLGSRGSKTESVTPRTNTAPAPAQSFQRSNPPAQNAAPRPMAPAQAVRAPAPRPAVQAQPSFASRAMASAAGFVTGAAIANLLRNTGFFDGMSGLAGILGMLLTYALIGALGAIIVALLRPQPESPGQMQGRLQAVGGAGGGSPANPNPAPTPRLDAPRPTFGRRGAAARR
jgi:hypothetical protein